MSYLKINNQEVKCLFFHTNFAELLMDLYYHTKFPIVLEYKDGKYESDYIKVLDINEQYIEYDCNSNYYEKQIYFDYKEKKFVIFINDELFEENRFVPVAEIPSESYVFLKNYNKKISFKY